MWGPYEELQPGDYAVAFRLSTIAPTAQTTVAALDVFDYAGSVTTGQGELAQGTAAGTSDGYRDVWLRFTVRQPLKAEYRVAWRGTGEVRVDRIVVVRLRSAGAPRK